MFFIYVLTIYSKKALSLNSCHGNQTNDLFSNFQLSEGLKAGISNTLQNLKPCRAKG